MKKTLSTLGLCRKAGKLVYGFDAVCEEIKKPGKKVAGVLIASDISAKSEKEVRFVCEKYSVVVLKAQLTMDEIKGVLTKRTGIIAFLDKGLFSAILKAEQSV